METADELAAPSCNSSAQNKKTCLETEKVIFVSEEMFDTIYERLSFVKEKLYFCFLNLFLLSLTL